MKAFSSAVTQAEGQQEVEARCEVDEQANHQEAEDLKILVFSRGLQNLHPARSFLSKAGITPDHSPAIC